MKIKVFEIFLLFICGMDIGLIAAWQLEATLVGRGVVSTYIAPVALVLLVILTLGQLWNLWSTRRRP